MQVTLCELMERCGTRHFLYAGKNWFLLHTHKGAKDALVYVEAYWPSDDQDAVQMPLDTLVEPLWLTVERPGQKPEAADTPAEPIFTERQWAAIKTCLEPLLTALGRGHAVALEQCWVDIRQRAERAADAAKGGKP